METVTLRGEDFRTIHNTLCELRSLVARMEQSMIKIEDVERIIQGFESGLADAYEQDSAAFEDKHDYYSSIQQEWGYRSIWSLYSLEVGQFSKQHPYKGAQQLAYKDHWGPAAVFEEIKGPTWLDLYDAADRVVRASGDDHHLFIEQFVVNPSCPEQLFLSTGS